MSQKRHYGYKPGRFDDGPSNFLHKLELIASGRPQKRTR